MLMEWIAALRAPLNHGALAKLGPIDFGDGLPALPAEYAVQLMLLDLDDFADMTPDEADDPATATLRARLLADFRVLQLLFD
jgi:hypothetical protein